MPKSTMVVTRYNLLRTNVTSYPNIKIDISRLIIEDRNKHTYINVAFLQTASIDAYISTHT